MLGATARRQEEEEEEEGGGLSSKAFIDTGVAGGRRFIQSKLNTENQVHAEGEEGRIQKEAY